MEAIYLWESIPDHAYILQEILTQLEHLNETQINFNHWSLALAAMNIGLLVMLIIVFIWGRK